jgi:hypothetical protein
MVKMVNVTEWKLSETAVSQFQKLSRAQNATDGLTRETAAQRPYPPSSEGHV